MFSYLRIDHPGRKLHVEPPRNTVHQILQDRQHPIGVTRIHLIQQNTLLTTVIIERLGSHVLIVYRLRQIVDGEGGLSAIGEPIEPQSSFLVELHSL